MEPRHVHSNNEHSLSLSRSCNTVLCTSFSRIRGTNLAVPECPGVVASLPGPHFLMQTRKRPLSLQTDVTDGYCDCLPLNPTNTALCDKQPGGRFRWRKPGRIEVPEANAYEAVLHRTRAPRHPTIDWLNGQITDPFTYHFWLSREVFSKVWQGGC